LLLFGSAAPEAHAAFPGKNGRIAFSTDFSRRSQIFTVLPDGTGLRQLTHVPKGHTATLPEWSPDRSRLLFTVDDSQIWVMNADGSHQRQLTHDANGASQEASWSPDGAKIVFARCLSPFGEQRCSIDVMNADGTGVTRLIGGNWVSQTPEYSPNGSRIAFASNRGGYVSNIWVMRTDGTGLKRITDPKLQAWAPDWSPDGTHIVFTSDAELPFPSVFAMRSDGTGLQELTHLADDHVGAFARYSPDGRKVVLVSDLAYPDHCCLDLYVMDADGSNLHTVDTSKPTVFATDWGPAVAP
jgi:Tol biopolymer transport system component